MYFTDIEIKNIISTKKYPFIFLDFWSRNGAYLLLIIFPILMTFYALAELKYDLQNFIHLDLKKQLLVSLVPLITFTYCYLGFKALLDSRHFKIIDIYPLPSFDRIIRSIENLNWTVHQRKTNFIVAYSNQTDFSIEHLIILYIDNGLIYFNSRPTKGAFTIYRDKRHFINFMKELKKQQLT